MANNNNQTCRWVFTLNNYDQEVNYRDHFSFAEFKIKRAVWGFEISNQNNTPHIQGYLEFVRSMRLINCKRILPTAYWDTARSSSLNNYRYCVKSGNFETYGDFTREEQGMDPNQKISNTTIIKGLLVSDFVPQIKISTQYAEKYLYFDRVSNFIRELQQEHDLFNEWKNKKLYVWQYSVLQKVMRQNNREVLWVIDTLGNRGKSYLCKYLCILYGYQYFDGIVGARDAVPMINDNVKGFCFDINRANLPKFDYGLLENLKTGLCVSGKYRGKLRKFESLPVVVFSNGFPKLEMLSLDRWNIITLGENEFASVDDDCTPVVSPSEVFPFISLMPLPTFDENFNLRDFLSTAHTRNGVADEVEHPAGVDPPDGRPTGFSQVAGPANTPITFTEPFQRPDLPTLRGGTAIERAVNATDGLACQIHNDQSLFKNGCPCLAKRKNNAKNNALVNADRPLPGIVPEADDHMVDPPAISREDNPTVHVTPVEENPAVHVTPVEENPAVHVTPVEENPAVHVTPVEENPAVHVTPVVSPPVPISSQENDEEILQSSYDEIPPNQESCFTKKRKNRLSFSKSQRSNASSVSLTNDHLSSQISDDEFTVPQPRKRKLKNKKTV